MAIPLCSRHPREIRTDGSPPDISVSCKYFRMNQSGPRGLGDLQPEFLDWASEKAVDRPSGASEFGAVRLMLGNFMMQPDLRYSNYE
jgi:hypothetical protein